MIDSFTVKQWLIRSQWNNDWFVHKCLKVKEYLVRANSQTTHARHARGLFLCILFLSSLHPREVAVSTYAPMPPLPASLSKHLATQLSDTRLCLALRRARVNPPGSPRRAVDRRSAARICIHLAIYLSIYRCIYLCVFLAVSIYVYRYTYT